MTEQQIIYYPPELDYKGPKYAPKGRYAFSKIVPNETIPQTITTSGGQSVEFRLPSGVRNLSKCELFLKMTPTAAGALKYNWFNASTMSMIERIELRTANNVFLMDARNVNKAMEIFNPIRYSLQELKENGVSGTTTRIAELPYASNNLATSSYAKTAKASTDGINYDGMGHVMGGGTVDTADPVVFVRFPMGKLWHTICEIDKSIYFSEILYLKIYWAPGTAIFFNSASTSDPSSTPLANALDISLDLVTFYDAREVDPVIIEKVKEATINSPGIWIDNYTVVSQSRTGTAQSHTFNINGSFGINLKRIYYTVWNSTESSNTMFDHENDADAKIVTFHTELDGKRMQEHELDTSIYEDYFELKPLLQYSCIRNHLQFAFQSEWIDYWDNVKKLDDCEQGLPLVNRQYNYTYSSVATSGTYIHSAYVVGQRKMRVVDGLILLDNSVNSI